MKVAAGYIRVSTDDQLEYSPDSQFKILQEYAKSHDILLAEEHIYREEEGKSGRKAEKRPEFMRMIAAAKQTPSPFDVILVWKYSRFARNQEESIVYKSLLQRQCGIEVISVSEPLIDGPFGSLIERIIEWMDEYYSIRLSGEVKRGMKEKIQRGEYAAGAPFGYQMVDGKLLFHPQNSSIAKMIFDDFIAGMGYKQIAMKLNDMGCHTKRGGAFDNRIVKYILMNPVYIGKVRWNPSGQINDHPNQSDTILVDGKHEPLISLDIWNQTVTRMEEIKSKYPKYAKLEVPQRYLLQGIIKCSNCGGGLVRANQGTRFQCAKYNHGTCKVSHSAPVDDLNKRSIDLICQSLESGKFQLVYKSTSSPDVTHIQQQINREKRKLARIKEAYSMGIDTLEEYRDNKKRIQDVILRLEEQQQPPKKLTKKQFADKFTPIAARLRETKLSETEKNDLLRGFVDKITFRRSENTLDVVFYV